LYYYKRKIKFKGNATIEFGLESFALRTFAIAVSFSVLIIQAAGVNLLAPLGSGVEQLYFILGLLASTGILVADLLRKLDPASGAIFKILWNGLCHERDVA